MSNTDLDEAMERLFPRSLEVRVDSQGLNQDRRILNIRNLTAAEVEQIARLLELAGIR